MERDSLYAISNHIRVPSGIRTSGMWIIFESSDSVEAVHVNDSLCFKPDKAVTGIDVTIHRHRM